MDYNDYDYNPAPAADTSAAPAQYYPAAAPAQYTGPSADPQAVPSDPKGRPRMKCGPHPVALSFYLIFNLVPFTLSLISFFVPSLRDSVYYIVFGNIIPMALNFWVTKNVAGRLLIGCRWHQYSKDGKKAYTYEAMPPPYKPNKCESAIFWIFLFFPIVYSVIMCIASIFALDVTKLLGAIVYVVCILISIPNITGYIRCVRDLKKKLRDALKEEAKKAVVDAAADKIATNI